MSDESWKKQVEILKQTLAEERRRFDEERWFFLIVNLI
jgi:hypothetical protein